MEFEYDQEGDTTQVFIAAGLICYLVPATLNRMSSESPVDPAKTLVERVDLSSQCKRKLQKLSKREKAEQGNGIKFWSVFYVVAWLGLAYTMYNIAQLEHELFYDPHAILGLDSSVTDSKAVTKQFRKMSLEYHPDRCPANGKAPDDKTCEDLFMKITKAKEALTDEETMKNIQKYGNPDGPQLKSFGIALPSWIVDPENSLQVLTLYFFLFMVVLPFVVGSWWYTRAKFYSDDIMLQTIKIFNSCLGNTANQKSLIEKMCWCEEFQQIPLREEDAPILQRLHKLYVSEGKEDLPTQFKKLFRLPNIQPPLKDGPVVRSRILLHCHVAGMHDELSHHPKLYDQLDTILAKAPALIDAMIEVAKYRRSIPMLKHIMHLSQMLVQGIDRRVEKAHLMQVPHFTPSTLKLCRGKKTKVETIRDLFQLDEETRNSAILRQMNEKHIEDVKRFGQAFPFVDVDADIVVKGEGDGEVTTNSTVTIRVKLKRLSMEGVTSLGISSTPKKELALEKSTAEEEEDVDAKNEAFAQKRLAQKAKRGKGKKKVTKKKKVAPAKPGAATEDAGDAAAKESDGDAPADANATKNAGAGADSADAGATASVGDTLGAGADDDAEADANSDSDSDSEAEDGGGDDGEDNDGGDGDDEEEDDEDFIPPEFEDDGTDKAKLKEFKARESYPVHCPRFPEAKDEWWWVFVGIAMATPNGQQQMLISEHHGAPDLKKVMTLKDEETVELVVRAPPRAGKYTLQLYMVSDSYLGIDHEEALVLDVKQGKEPEMPKEDVEEFDDDDEFDLSDSSSEDSDDFD